MSKLGLLNFYLLQWLGVRLAAYGNSREEREGWMLLVGVMPLTGWWNSYIGPAWRVTLSGSGFGRQA